ncbi:MAG: nitroreductase family protein [Gammaproteobacteria bacterium]
MDLLDVMHSTGTCRYYTPDPVPDAVLANVLDAARWAPSGGNRQPVSLVAIRERATKERLQALYLPFWDAYVAGIDAGTVRVGSRDSRILEAADHFARHLADIPVLVCVCARLADVHPTDTALDRLSIVGGASVYPAVQNVLLAARNAGLGSALTTLLCAVEPAVKALLEIPEDVSTAALLALGYPARPFPARLNRRPLDEMAFSEKFGRPLGG